MPANKVQRIRCIIGRCFPFFRANLVRFNETILVHSVNSMTASYSTSIDLLLNPFVSNDEKRLLYFFFTKKDYIRVPLDPSKFVEMIFATNVKFASTSFTDSRVKPALYEPACLPDYDHKWFCCNMHIVRGNLSGFNPLKLSEWHNSRYIYHYSLSNELFSKYHPADKRQSNGSVIIKLY